MPTSPQMYAHTIPAWQNAIKHHVLRKQRRLITSLVTRCDSSNIFTFIFSDGSANIQHWHWSRFDRVTVKHRMSLFMYHSQNI